MALGAASLTPGASSEDSAGLVPAEECPPSVVAAYEDQGLHIDFFGSCPDVNEAMERARSVNHMRRNGLTKILQGMRANGAPAEVQAPIVAELEQLGGPWVYPRDR